MNIKVEQVLKYKEDGQARKVLAILEQCALLSTTFNHEAVSGWATFKEIEEAYELPKEKWIPGIKEYYYYFDNEFEVCNTKNEGHEIDLINIDYRNCFRTEEECKAALEKIKKILAE